MLDDVVQSNMRVKACARVSAGADRPANAVTGLSGVAKVEKTRWYQTTSGFNLRIVFNSRAGFDKPPNFQQRIMLNPGSSGSSLRRDCLAVLVGYEVITGQFVGENRQLHIAMAPELVGDVKRILVQLASAGGEGSKLDKFSSVLCL